MVLRITRTILIVFCLILYLFPLSALSQDAVRIVDEDQSSGITLELDANALAPASGSIAISDSGGQAFALSGLVLDDENIWIKNSNEESNRENAAHWHFDEDSRLLFIDLNGIRESLSTATILQLTVLPLKSYTKSFSLSVFEAPANAGNSPEDLQKISDLNIDLK